MSKALTEDFFNVLFDRDEHVCVTTTATGTRVYPFFNQLATIEQTGVYYSINALHPTNDLAVSAPYHRSDKPRRCDKNVVTFRNILIEMDTLPLDEQEGFIQATGMPFSTAVFSGGKSIHFVISLITPLSSADEYKRLVLRLYTALGGSKYIDVSCKNPSRLSRFPLAMREDRGNVIQEIIAIKERVANEELEAWLSSKGAGKETEIVKKKVNNMTNTLNSSGQSDSGSLYYSYGKNEISPLRSLSGHTLNFIMFGADEGGRNRALFSAACDFARCAKTPEEAFDRLFEASGLEEAEVLNTIGSAFQRVEADAE